MRWALSPLRAVAASTPRMLAGRPASTDGPRGRFATLAGDARRPPRPRADRRRGGPRAGLRGRLAGPRAGGGVDRHRLAGRLRHAHRARRRRAHRRRDHRRGLGHRGRRGRGGRARLAGRRARQRARRGARAPRRPLRRARDRQGRAPHRHGDGRDGVVYAGRIAGLEVEGRPIGDIRKPSRYVLSDGGSVVVNKGRSAIRVTLGAARGELPAGTRVDVAVARASAADQVVATPTPTPTRDADADADAPSRRRRPASAARPRRCASA